MGVVASLGSINVDQVRRVDAAALDRLTDQYDWFPAPGETRRVESIPASVDALSFTDGVGGKGANQAVAAAHAGASATLYGRVGPDAETFGVREAIDGAGVDTAPVDVVADETGKAYVFVDDAGESHIAIVAGANARVDEAYVRQHLDALGQADVVLLQNEIPTAAMEAFLAALDDESARPRVVFDPAPADGAAALLTHPCVDVVTPNELEYAAIGPALANFEGTVVQTRAERDVVVEGPTSFRVTPPRVDPVDTTGAGDTFNGFLANELAEGRDIDAAVRVATIAASLATESPGAQTMPTRSGVDAYLE